MTLRERTKKQRHGERGSTLYLVAGSMAILLGMGALAIDLASLYVARNEAQRAADSAALAGAKLFVESGCVTSANCSPEADTAEDRATQVASQILVGGQPVTNPVIMFDGLTSQNPRITVQVQSADLSIYFARAIGVTTAPTVSATATAEAYNPSGSTEGPTFCTGCVRPWLIANSGGSLLSPAGNYSVTSPGCATAGGVVGRSVDINLETEPTLYGAMDVDGGSGNLTDYQSAITTCFTGQTTCGVKTLSVLPVNGGTASATVTGVENLLHITATGPGLGQDTIDATVCPPQIQAGALNPLTRNGVVSPGDAISTSDSIVTAYIFDPATTLTTSTTASVSQSVSIVGFAQIFVTQVAPNGDVSGVILGVAGCGSNTGGSCGRGSIKGPTMLPVRLIQGAD